MRILAVLTMLVACLVYGFMPARASVLMDGAAAQAGVENAHAGHHGVAAKVAGGEAGASGSGDPCPHRGGPAHAPFCAACLAIVPVADVARDGHPPFSWPDPAPARALADLSPAPAEPPPRS